MHNLGCRVNRVETDSIAASLISAGACPGALNEADLVVVNTCTVTAEAASKARKAVHQALCKAPKATVIATGCAASMDPGSFLNMDKRVIVEADKSRMPVLAASILGLDGSANPDAAYFSRAGGSFMDRAGIKIQDGCANACTYCIIHVARGPVWSKPFDEAVNEVRAAWCNGVGEVVLVGINLGSYQGGCSVVELLAKLLSVARELDGDDDSIRHRLRLSSIEPLDVTEGLIELMGESQGRLCRHLHLSLQSGSDKVLSEMGRPYSAEEFLTLVGRLHRAVPRISLSTDVIAGFPGETDEDFLETVRVCEETAFSRLHVFRYSRRAGTPAAARLDQVSPSVASERARLLRTVGMNLAMEDAAKREGFPERVCVEGDGCTSESFHVARFDHPMKHEPGELVDVRVTGTDGACLLVHEDEGGVGL